MRAALLSAMIAALGGLLFGFDTAVISGTTDALTQVFKLTESQLGFVVASALLGTIVGSMLSGLAADRLGRRNSLFLIGVLYLVSAVGSALAPTANALIAFRLLGGIGVGGASVIAAMYIAEISPARYRGILVGAFQLNIVLGILVAYLSNYVVSEIGRSVSAASAGAGADPAALRAAYLSWFNDVGWRWMFGTEAFPAALFALLVLFTPRSPRWLVARGREAEARRVLAKLGSEERTVDAQVAAIRESLAAVAVDLHEPLFRKAYLRPILLVLALATFNQLSGINAVLYYAPTIFAKSGASQEAMLLYPVGLGLTNLIFTLVGLAMIDRMGRRFLLLIGSVGYILSLGAASFAFFVYGPDFDRTSSMVVLGALAAFIASHAVGQGAVIWVYIGEIFPNAIRGKGQALGGLTHWAWAAGLSYAFPPLLAKLGGAWIFALFCGLMVLQLVWVLTLVPETKGIPLEEIQKNLGIET